MTLQLCRDNGTIDHPTSRQEALDLVAACEGDPKSRDGRLVADVIITSLKLITDERDTGELKLLTIPSRRSGTPWGSPPATEVNA